MDHVGSDMMDLGRRDVECSVVVVPGNKDVAYDDEWSETTSIHDRVLDQLILSGGFSLSMIAGYRNGTWAKWVPYWYFGARYSADTVAGCTACIMSLLFPGNGCY